MYVYINIYTYIYGNSSTFIMEILKPGKSVSLLRLGPGLWKQLSSFIYRGFPKSSVTLLWLHIYLAGVIEAMCPTLTGSIAVGFPLHKWRGFRIFYGVSLIRSLNKVGLLVTQDTKISCDVTVMLYHHLCRNISHILILFDLRQHDADVTSLLSHTSRFIRVL